MPLNQSHACRKHAQDFLRSLEIKDPSDFTAYSLESVSYTHLTLPTSDLV